MDLPNLTQQEKLDYLANLQAKVNLHRSTPKAEPVKFELPDPVVIKGRDGLDGKDGIDGAPGKDGKPGKNGKDGRDGVDGKDGKSIEGKPGLEGKAGVSVVSAEVTFDNHLVLTLSDGNEIDAGEIHIESKNSTVVQVVQKDGDGDMNLTVRYDQVDPSVAYKGDAITGASGSSALWRIQKLSYSADGDVTVTWADGTQDFRFVWDDRASLTYT